MLRRILLALIVLPAALPWVASGQGSSFDKLPEPERQAFSERFRRELWPLLTRGGKDGCAGCHTAKHQSGLRMTGDADADFRHMLRDGFLLKDDPGSMLASVTRKDRRRMPPGNRPSWTAEEVRVLRAFVQDLDSKQRR